MAMFSKMGLSACDQIETLAARGVFVRANQHFLGSAAAGNQADAGFDQADIGFRRGVNSRARAK